MRRPSCLLASARPRCIPRRHCEVHESAPGRTVRLRQHFVSSLHPLDVSPTARTSQTRPGCHHVALPFHDCCPTLWTHRIARFIVDRKVPRIDTVSYTHLTLPTKRIV